MLKNFHQAILPHIEKYNGVPEIFNKKITIPNLFLEQDQKCALSGILLEPWISNNKKQGRRMSASLDRIDSSKGYIVGNVQWVHKDINRLKWDLSQEKFIELCKLVAEYNEK
jgi:hypothetical protein